MDEDLIVVPHSNAGLYVPAIAAHRRALSFVFVDALLPAASGRIELAPPAALLDVLRDKADENGVLPPWTAWWPEADVAALFPVDTVRASVEREQPRLPLSYFDGSLPIPPGWDQRPGAYLAFGESYSDERGDAARRGWPVATIAGTHLHMLVDPEQVASQILTLLNAAARRPAPR